MSAEQDNSENLADDGASRRKKPRYASHVQVEIMAKGLNHVVAARTANISDTGLFACTDYLGTVGEKLHIRVILIDREAYFDCRAAIVWVADGQGSHPQGVGLQFIELSADQRSVIERSLTTYVNTRRN